MLGTLPDDPWAGRDAARRARYREYLAFYEGDQWQGRPLPGERRLTINYVRALVRKCVSYLFPEPVTFAVTPDGSDDLARGGGADARLRRERSRHGRFQRRHRRGGPRGRRVQGRLG